MTPSLAKVQPYRSDLEVWWLHPGWSVAAMASVIIPASYLIPDWVYRQYWRMPKLVDWHVMILCLVCISAFVAGSFIGATRSHSTVREPRFAWTQDLPWPLIYQLFNWSFYLTVAGYAIWGASAVARGLNLNVVLAVLQGAKGAGALVKDQYLVTISGVTTLTQFGHVGIVLGGVIGCIHGWRHVRFKVGLIFLLAVVRAFLNSERLAIIELAVPLAVVIIRLAVLDSPKMVGILRLLVVAAPVYGGVVLLVLFAASEYFRSWINYYSGGDLSFFQFVSLRLLGYYVTAINNGALLLQRVAPTGAPFFTMHFLWRFPISSDIVRSIYPDLPFGNDDDPYMTILDVGANPEFNNGDGYLIPILDYGVFGALLYWVVMGLLCGWLYRMFCRKHPLGLFLYPIAFIGIAEMPRVVYWAEGRIVPGIIGLAVVGYICLRHRARSQERRMNEFYALGRIVNV